MKADFFSDLMLEIEKNDLILLEENSCGYFLPFVNQDAYLAKYFRVLAKIIVQCAVQGGPCFEKFPPAVYFYMAANMDTAVQYLTAESLPSDAFFVVNQVM